jgi:hypothetical protein
MYNLSINYIFKMTTKIIPLHQWYVHENCICGDVYNKINGYYIFERHKILKYKTKKDGKKFVKINDTTIFELGKPDRYFNEQTQLNKLQTYE